MLLHLLNLVGALASDPDEAPIDSGLAEMAAGMWIPPPLHRDIDVLDWTGEHLRRAFPLALVVTYEGELPDRAQMPPHGSNWLLFSDRWRVLDSAWGEVEQCCVEHWRNDAGFEFETRPYFNISERVLVFAEPFHLTTVSGVGGSIENMAHYDQHPLLLAPEAIAYTGPKAALAVTDEDWVVDRKGRPVCLGLEADGPFFVDCVVEGEHTTLEQVLEALRAVPSDVPELVLPGVP